MKLPIHFFIPDGGYGGLYDTRKPNWNEKPIRPIYKFTYKTITNCQTFKATLRTGDFAWPGGYPLYFVTSDGAAISFNSARKNLREIYDSIKMKANDGWRITGCDINYEDQDLFCDHSGEKIEAAYE